MSQPLSPLLSGVSSEQKYDGFEQENQCVPSDDELNYYLEMTTNESNDSCYQNFRRKMLEERPELANRTKEEIVKEFDRLSNKIAEGFHFETLEEMERFMRSEANCQSTDKQTPR